MKHVLSFQVFESDVEQSQIMSIVKSYIRDSKYDLYNSLGNCAFFAKDVYEWAEKNGMTPSLIYLSHKDQESEESEDHIIPIIGGYAIDFVYTPQGVSRKYRKGNPEAFEYQVDPEITPLPEVQKKYKGFGYPDYSIISFEEAFGNDGKVRNIEVPEKLS